MRDGVPEERSGIEVEHLHGDDLVHLSPRAAALVDEAHAPAALELVIVGIVFFVLFRV